MTMLCDERILCERAAESSAIRCNRQRQTMCDYTLNIWWGIEIHLTQWMRYANIYIYKCVKNLQKKRKEKKREENFTRFTLAKPTDTWHSFLIFTLIRQTGKCIFAVKKKLHSLLFVVPLVGYIPNQFHCTYDLLSPSISCELTKSNIECYRQHKFISSSKWWWSTSQTDWITKEKC